jgi:hypothetical protein
MIEPYDSEMAAARASGRPRYRPAPIDERPVLQLLSVFEGLYSNGKVLVSHLVGGQEPSSQVDIRRSSLGARLSWFLRSVAEDQCVPDLGRIRSEDVPPIDSWTTFRSYTFEGVLIEKLLLGGMYTQGAVEPDAARVLAKDFVDTVAPDRPHAEFLRLDSAWTPWFFDMLDDTLVITAWGTDDWWLIATTDTD